MGRQARPDQETGHEADKTQKKQKKTKRNPSKNGGHLEKRLDLVSDDAYEMPTELHKPNNNKAAMRVLLISLAALLSLELMTTVQCK